MQSNSSAALQPKKAVNETSLTVTDPAAPAGINLVGKEILFPHGLLGFGDVRYYRLKRFDHGEVKESPFFILESLDGQLSFPLIRPDSLGIDYRLPDLSELLVGLEARSAADLVVLLIVTVRDRVEETTVNLQGPLVISASALIGMQIVVEEYPLRYSLLSPADG